MKIISISNRKGGVGKTTTAINLATALSTVNKKVLVIDLDPQGNATTSMGISKQNQHTSYDLLTKNASVNQTIVHTNVPRFDIIPSTPDLAAAEIELINAQNRQFILKNALQNINDLFDYVFIDCPPSLNLITVNALSCSDSVIVPLQCEFLALEGLADLMKNINSIKRNFNPSLSLQGILLTMYSKRNNLSKMIEADVRKYFGDKVYKSIIPRSVRIAEAPSYGKPILLYDFHNIASQAYISLAREFLQQEKEI